MILNSIIYKKDGAILNYGEENSLLIDNTLIKKYNLQPDKEFNINEILSDNEEYAKQLAKEYALNFLSYAARSEKQVYEHLRKKHIQKRAVEATVEMLKSHNYINDNDFASVFCENMKLSGKSKRYISQKLTEKGIAPLIIEDVLQCYTTDEQFHNAQRFLESKNKSMKKYPPKIRKEKLYRSALSQGFSQDTVQKITNELLKDEDSDFDDYYKALILKKVSSLKRKNLTDKELKLKAYTALLPKGTPKDLIDSIIENYEDENEMT